MNEILFSAMHEISFKALPHFLLYAPAVLAAVWGLIMIAGLLPLLALWRAPLVEVPEDAAKEHLRTVLSSGKVPWTWPADEGFEPVDVFQIKDGMINPVVVGWRKPHENTYLCAYVFQKSRVELDCVSIFGPDSLLTTGTTRDGQLLPEGPDNWMQTFGVADAEELWVHHQEALDYLSSTHGLTPISNDNTLQDDLSSALAAQAAFIRSLPLWWLRIPYWFFVRRLTRHNKPVSELS